MQFWLVNWADSKPEVEEVCASQLNFQFNCFKAHARRQTCYRDFSIKRKVVSSQRSLPNDTPAQVRHNCCTVRRRSIPFLSHLNSAMQSEEKAEMGRPTVIIYAGPNLRYSERDNPAVQSSEHLPICNNEKWENNTCKKHQDEKHFLNTFFSHKIKIPFLSNHTYILLKGRS